MPSPFESPRRPWHVAPALLAAVAISVGAVGCGIEEGSGPAGGGLVVAEGGATTPSPAVPDEGSFEGTGGAVFLRQAAQATSGVTALKMAMTTSVTDMPMLGDVAFTYDGEFDTRTGRGRMTADIGDLVRAMDEGDGGGSGRMELVIDGDVVYLRSDLFADVADGKPWVTLSQEGSGIGSTPALGVQSDPTAFLSFLEGVGDDVETVGREDLRGVPTTHVRTDIDLPALLAEASDAHRAELEERLDGLGSAADLLPSIPVEAWVDDDGYVRRYLMSFDMSGVTDENGAALGALAVTVDVELFDFNEPVEVVIPDPADVTDLDELALGLFEMAGD